MDGSDALAKMNFKAPDIVVTDLDMPSINGLKLVELIHQSYPAIPVILMTARGSEEIAVKALQAGASSYVPKRQLNYQLSETVRQVLQAAQHTRAHLRLKRRLVRYEVEFCIENDQELISSLVQFLQDAVTEMGACDESDRVRIGVALQEALTNACFHGNLELSSSIRETDHRAYYDMAIQRIGAKPWSDRRIRISGRFTPDEVEFIIRDDGPGFDPKCLPDPRDPANLERPCGRGLLLMYTFMDAIQYNETGNEVRLTKRRRSVENGSAGLPRDSSELVVKECSPE